MTCEKRGFNGHQTLAGKNGKIYGLIGKGGVIVNLGTAVVHAVAFV